MTAVWIDPDFDDDARRAAVYRGDLIVHSPTRSSLELVAFARAHLTEAFGGLDPRSAQHQLPVEEYARILGSAKPEFIHHARSKELLRDLLSEIGCAPEETYFDVPRMRTSTSNGYLTTGIAYAFHPHRDTWYSAPMCQINWWIPVWGLLPDNCMAFHPRYWDEPVRNSSEIYNYQEWNRHSRFAAASQIGRDERLQPAPLQAVEQKPDIRILPKPGGVLVFSAAQLHSSVENLSAQTRVSMDFRTVNVRDALNLSGARNVDSRCTGSTMDDYIRVSDFERLPQAATAPYEQGPPQAALAEQGVDDV